MKKLLILIGLSMIFVTNAWAGYDYKPLMVWGDARGSGSVHKFKISGKSYTITDRHQTGISGDSDNPGDQFSDTYKGYYSLFPNYNPNGTDMNGSSFDNFSGFYLGTIASKNDDPKAANGKLATLISYYLGATGDDTFTITDFSKVEVDSTHKNEEYHNKDLTVSSPDGWKSGKWGFSGNSSKAVEFYTVKSAQEYALYYINPAKRNGVWTTAHLLTKVNVNGKGGNIPQLSHFSGILTTPGAPGNPVPEPATMILFGFGLLGIAGICKKKNRLFA